jgi:hypothetical protein
MRQGDSIEARFDEAGYMSTTSKRPRSQHDRDWNNGVLLIAAIVGLPVIVVALVAVLVG